MAHQLLDDRSCRAAAGCALEKQVNELHVYIRMADTLVLEAKPKPKPPQHPPVPQQPHPQHHSPGDENVVERLQKPRSRLVGVRQRTTTQEPVRRGEGKTKRGRGAPSAHARIHAPARCTARVATTNALRSKNPRSRSEIYCRPERMLVG